VRGRIPFFVAPPERSAELNEREAKDRARLAKSKGKGSVEEKRVPGVKQNLGSIMQKNTFVEEDVRPLEGIELEGESEDGDVEEEGDETVVDGDGADSEKDAPLAWGDVFVEERSTVPTEAGGPGDEVEEDEDEEWSGITSLPREGA
jgi:nuclear GTP-binding protein